MRSKAGGALKHSTGRMKMIHMHHVMAFQDDLRDSQFHEQQKLHELHERQYILYQRLIELDPAGGEAWFDDDNNVPAEGPIVDRIAILEARIKELEAK